MSENERSTVEVLNAQDVGRTVARIAHQIIEKTALDDETSPQVVLLGSPSGGVPLAQRIAEAVEEFSGVAVPVGAAVLVRLAQDGRSQGEVDVGARLMADRSVLPVAVRNRC